ncbi:MAG: DNA starvation/stationary phase protection protein [Proteobacteria bacterium]|nr:DNA starvation/stationary phase protection protein [Pseudomonadota bacterium]
MKTNQKLISGFSRLLADTYFLYLKTQNFHWNVVGIEFVNLHHLFEQQYTGLADAVDTIAERIRALGGMAPGSFAEFSKLTKLKESTKKLTAAEMIKQLIHDHEILIETAKAVGNASEDANDLSSADLATVRIAEHEKTLWMLQSLLAK